MLRFALARIVVTIISFCLTQAAGVTGGSFSNAVDLYNGATGKWSTAQLSVARGYLTSTSVGNVVLFAGGAISGVLSVFWPCFIGGVWPIVSESIWHGAPL